MKRVVWIAIGVLVLVAGVAVARSWQQGVPVEYARVRIQPIRQYIDEQGMTRLPQIHLITMPYDARIEPITLREGAPVERGQVVAQVVQVDLQSAVAEARAVVEQLTAAMRENDDATIEHTGEEQSLKFVESIRHTVEAAQARMEAGKAALDYAESNLGRVEKLAEPGVSTLDEVELARLALVRGQTNYRQDVLIYRAMTAVEAATVLLPRMIQQYIDRKSLSRAVLEKQRAEAQERLAQMELRQQRGTMTSPTDGEVLTRHVQVEQQLAAGTLLLEIGNLNELEIEADLLTQDAVEVAAGQRVEIYGPAVGRRMGDGVPGVLDRVYPAGFTKISSLGVEQQRVKVVVHFAEGVLPELLTKQQLGVHYRVRVRVYTDEHEQAKVIPRSALFRGPDGGWQVFAVRGEHAVLQAVEVGLMNDDQVEVMTGLEPDELVVLAPESNLVNGARVAIEP